MLTRITQSPNYKWWAFCAVAIGTFASVADQVSVNVAMHPISRYFQTDIPTVQWVILSYTLTISALLLPMGRLADIIGLKKVYIIGSLVFALFALAAGLSRSMELLIGFRVLQGAGAAMTQGTGMAIIVASFPVAERGRAIGLMMAVVSLGAIGGPLIGGLLLEWFGWRAIFLVNLPMVGLGVSLALLVLTETRAADSGQSRPGFDWLGAALSTAALLLLLLTVTNAYRFGWTSPPILTALVLFVGLLAAFIWQELRTPNPMLNPRFFRGRAFSGGVTAAFLAFFGGISIFFLTPFYLQGVLGYSPLWTGLVLVPGAMCMLVLGPLSGWLSERFGFRIFTIGGLLCSAASLFILSWVRVDTSLAILLPALILQSCGMGLFFSPNASSVLNAVGRESYGVVSAFLNLVRNSGNVISIALSTAIVTATMGSLGYEPSLSAVQVGGAAGVGHAFTAGLRYTYLLMTALLLIAAAISTLRPRPQ